MTTRRKGLLGAAVAAASALLVTLSGCQISTPFRGPGYRSSEGVTLPDAKETVLVSVTHAVLDPERRKPFDDYTRVVVESLPKQEGLIGWSVRKQPFGDEAWTLTVWRDHAAMRAFVDSDAHRAAMRNGRIALREARFHHYEVPRAAMPPRWDEVLQILKEVPARSYDR